MYRTTMLLNQCKLSFNILKQLNKNSTILHLQNGQKLSLNYFMQNSRSYLSPAFNCENKWNSRLTDPIIKDIKSVEFYYELLRKYKRDGKVSSIDVDIFINSIKNSNVEDFCEEIEEIVRLLRRSPETTNTLPSTQHSVIRILMEGKKYDLIFKLLSNPMNYGVFLDFYTSNLLMDTLIKGGNYMGAARIASNLMLQEDYGPPLSQSLVMLSCFKYIFNPNENDEWIDFNPHEEPEEEVKIIVKYIRNPYFDDHFDLKEPLHIVGKTLAWLTFHLEDSPLKHNSEVLGWALFEKWAELKQSLERVLKEKVQLDEAVFSKVLERVEQCPEDVRKQLNLSSITEQIKSSNLISSPWILEEIEKTVNELVSKHEQEAIQEQEAVYETWAEIRKKALEEHLELIERNRLIKEMQEKKDDLARREDVIFFFENRNKFDLLTPRKRKYYPKKRSLIFPKKKPRAIDQEYIPPEV